MIYSYLIKHIDENLSINQALEEIISKINHKIQVSNSEEKLMQDFLNLLQKSIPFINEKVDEYSNKKEFSYHYYFSRKVHPSTILRKLKEGKNAKKLIECLYIFMNSKYKDWDHFLTDYSYSLLWTLGHNFNNYAMRITNDQLLKISEVIKELNNWISKANYEFKNIYLWIKQTYFKILAFKANFQSLQAKEEIEKEIILKQEETSYLRQEMQNVISFNQKCNVFRLN